MSKICSACHAENPDSASFCTNCGAALPERQSRLDTQWYVYQNKERIGPLSEPELIYLVKSGAILTDAYVWTAGLQDWTPLRKSSLAYLAADPQENESESEYGEDEASAAKAVWTLIAVVAQGLCILGTMASELMYAITVAKGEADSARTWSIASAVCTGVFMFFMGLADCLLLSEENKTQFSRGQRWVYSFQNIFNFYPLFIVLWITVVLLMSS